MNSFLVRDCSTPRGSFPASLKAQVPQPESPRPAAVESTNELRLLDIEHQANFSLVASKKNRFLFTNMEAMTWRHTQDLTDFSFLYCLLQKLLFFFSTLHVIVSLFL